MGRVQLVLCVTGYFVNVSFGQFIHLPVIYQDFQIDESTEYGKLNVWVR